MDNQRLILLVALAFVLLLIWQAWQQDYAPPQAARTTPEGETTQAPTGRAPDSGDVPTAPAQSPGSVPSAARASPGLPRGQRIHVRTDLIHSEIDTHGGDLRRVDLLAYPEAIDSPEEPFRLMEDAPDRVFIAQSGLIAQSGPTVDHNTRYEAEGTEYLLGDRDSITVPLTTTTEQGLQVEKVYTFRRNSYVIELVHRVRNATDTDWTGRQYLQLQRSPPSEAEKSRFIYTYDGGAVWSPEDHYQKIKYPNMEGEPFGRTITDGWGAIIQHYFVGAVIPARDQANHFFARQLSNGRYALGHITPPTVVPAADSAEFDTSLFVGPKEQDRMAAAAQGLELSVDYGYLTFIAQPLFWLLNQINRLFHNWGWSIIVLTILIKLAFYKLSETSYRSMANMRKLAPRLQELKDKFGDNKQLLNQKMMELYKTEKINPLGGCLPILIQIPVFIALYWVLLESVEMRQAPWILWIDDLSAKDPYFVLPILMGITMVVQQRLNPAPMDPVQQKIMMVLPLVFTVFFAFFPAGLVLYWFVNNLLSIAQQWVITRRIEKAPAKA
jgi:YidC/Oxa1 family membrane protein insertase